jgi:hypothetical protein
MGQPARRLDDAFPADTGVADTVSVPNERAAPVSQSPGSAGRRTADGRLIFRMVTPLVIWWTWVAVIAASLLDLIIQGHDFLSLQFALGTLTVTGLVYACTLWSKVIASDDGITVLNPFRRFDVPWGAVRGIFLADSVEVRCARGGGKKDKTIYTWALSAPRRARAKAQLRGRQWETGRRAQPGGYDKMPGQAKELVKMTPAEVIARELAALSEQVNSGLDGGEQPSAVMTARWAWQPAAAVLVPGIAFALVSLIH